MAWMEGGRRGKDVMSRVLSSTTTEREMIANEQEKNSGPHVPFFPHVDVGGSSISVRPSLGLNPVIFKTVDFVQ